MKKPDPRAPFIPQGFVEREIGRWRPKRFDIRREREMEAQLAERQALWRVALLAASPKKQEWAPRMYRGEVLSLEDWPELAPLTPEERTALLVEVYRQWGITYPLHCGCPRRREGEHYNECSPLHPWRRGGRA